jgi:CspA family cold shock protein
MATGTVKWFNDKKGYGFIVSDSTTEDIFVHYSAIQSDGFRTLDKGEAVEFELFQDDKGARAREVVRHGATQ